MAERLSGALGNKLACVYKAHALGFAEGMAKIAAAGEWLITETRLEPLAGLQPAPILRGQYRAGSCLYRCARRPAPGPKLDLRQRIEHRRNPRGREQRHILFARAIQNQICGPSPSAWRTLSASPKVAVKNTRARLRQRRRRVRRRARSLGLHHSGVAVRPARFEEAPPLLNGGEIDRQPREPGSARAMEEKRVYLPWKLRCTVSMGP